MSEINPDIADDVMLRFEQCNQKLKDYAAVLKTYPKIVDDYKAYYENKAIEATRACDLFTRKSEECSNLNTNGKDLNLLVNELKSDLKFQESLKGIRFLNRDLKGKK